jgi:2-phosphosulfolactate phosphatase
MTATPLIYFCRGAAGCALSCRQAGVAIVVDALRASVTMALLLTSGVARILVTARVEDARALAQHYPDAILVGERGGERIPGFHLGNSPAEILASPRMDGATAIFTSSNGAQRLVACREASCVLVGSVANAGVLAPTVRAQACATGRPVVLIAAGKWPDEQFVSPEDAASCAYLAEMIGLPVAGETQEEYVEWREALHRQGLDAIFRESRHAQRLMEIGYSDDVLFCARPDTAPALPVVVDDVRVGGRVVGAELQRLTDEMGV